MLKAVFIALLMSLAMTFISAFIRLADSGIGCEIWPACYTSNIWIDAEPGINIRADDSHTGLRALHRMLASIFGLLIMTMMLVSVWHRKHNPRGVLESALAFGLTLVLALVGVNTPNITLPVITLINLAGGMLLAAILYFWMRKLVDPNLGFWKGQKLLIATSALVFMVIVSGAWMSSNFAAAACESTLACSGLGASSLSEAFSLTRELTVLDGQLISDGNEPIIGFVHHLLAPVMVLLVTYVGVTQYRQNQAPVRVAILSTTMMLLVLQGITGMVNQSQLIASFHNSLSVILLLSILSLFKGEPDHD